MNGAMDELHVGESIADQGPVKRDNNTRIIALHDYHFYLIPMYTLLTPINYNLIIVTNKFAEPLNMKILAKLMSTLTKQITFKVRHLIQ